ncbi:cytochrome P450 [Mycena sanguinolenta]|nr:cytochrome P450 [Mycena sanguinolenta]
MPSADYLLVVAVSAILLVVVVKRWKATSRLPFPPGPKPRFLVGNLFDIPTEMPWITYTEWGKQYGDVVHAQAFGQHILILNSVKAATELLEKRAIIYSDRSTIPMIPLMGWDFSFAFIPHSDKWREETVSSAFSLRRYSRISPEDFEAHIDTLASAIIMTNMYGYNIRSTHDRFIYLAKEAVERLSESVFPGTFAVNTFHSCVTSLPGFRVVVSSDSPELNGAGRSSVLRELLEQNDTHGSSKEREQVIKDVAAVAYVPAADTTNATLIVFIMAMALNPAVVQKAQNELDTVVGLGSLPGFEHRSALPYCEAVFRETFRWRPILPLSIAHAASGDDFYEGYFLPKGTMVLPNVWAMVHDESKYPNPDIFDPERFLNADGQLSADDQILGFGFGRRACAGRYAADATVWATIVTVLSTFNIAKAKDETGKEIEIEPVFADGMVR